MTDQQDYTIDLSKFLQNFLVNKISIYIQDTHLMLSDILSVNLPIVLFVKLIIGLTGI